MIPLPTDLAALAADSTWERVTRGESGAQVYRLRAGGETRYLKVETLTPSAEPLAEAARLRWLRGRLPVPALLYAGADGRRSYTLTAAVPGADATDGRWMADPARLVGLLADGLLAIHSLPIHGCPFDQRLGAELPAELQVGRPPAEDLVLSHGDYCLPNVIIDGWLISGYIDLGRCGVSDRYHDLAQATRSIERNLGAAWVAPFLAAYGIARPDNAKLRYYRLLDELF